MGWADAFVIVGGLFLICGSICVYRWIELNSKK